MSLPRGLIGFEVHGEPAPQGSKDAWRGRDGKLHVTEVMSVKVKAWRRAVYSSARIARSDAGMPPGEDPYFEKDVPVAVTVEFRMRRGSTVTRALPTTAPDLDKLVRSTFDAITSSKLWADDSQVCHMVVAERYAAAGEPAGAYITLNPIPTEGES